VLGSNQRRLSRRFYSPVLLPEPSPADQHKRQPRLRPGPRPSAICPCSQGLTGREGHGRARDGARTARWGAVWLTARAALLPLTGLFLVDTIQDLRWVPRSASLPGLSVLSIRRAVEAPVIARHRCCGNAEQLRAGTSGGLPCPDRAGRSEGMTLPAGST
jgi:hypothetical protein